MKLFFFAFVVSQIIIFLTPFMVFDVDVIRSYAADSFIVNFESRPDVLWSLTESKMDFLSIQYVDGYLNKIVYKFSLDRLPLWLGSIRCY